MYTIFDVIIKTKKQITMRTIIMSFFYLLTFRAFPTRLCAAMWWFFALIMTQSYTANWTAFLTSNRMETTINNVEDLDKKGGTEGITYGCVVDQSTASFFQVGTNIFRIKTF